MMSVESMEEMGGENSFNDLKIIIKQPHWLQTNIITRESWFCKAKLPEISSAESADASRFDRADSVSVRLFISLSVENPSRNPTTECQTSRLSGA